MKEKTTADFTVKSIGNQVKAHGATVIDLKSRHLHFGKALEDRLALSPTVVEFLQTHLHPNIFIDQGPYRTIRKTNFRYKYWRTYIQKNELMETQNNCRRVLKKMDHALFTNIYETKNLSVEYVNKLWKPRILEKCIK